MSDNPQINSPTPPHGLMSRVVGNTDANHFTRSGEITLGCFRDALTRIGRSIADFEDIYDFGCGCGRVLPWLRKSAPAARIFGSDTDIPAIMWVRNNIPEVEARINNRLPPLPFRAGQFDLVLGCSVFTHLDENYQDAWLAELRRVTKPGAVLLLSVIGPTGWRLSAEKMREGVTEFQQLETELLQKGFLYWRDNFWVGHFPDYYRTSWHLPYYIRSHWSRWFEVVEVLEEGARPVQDMVVLRRR